MSSALQRVIRQSVKIVNVQSMNGPVLFEAVQPVLQYTKVHPKTGHEGPEVE